MKFTIQISELLTHNITVEAETAEEAKKKAQDNYYNVNIIFTADDYVDGSVHLKWLK